MHNCPVWKEFYSVNSKTNLMKMRDFLCGVCKSGEWKLIIPRNFVFAGKDFYEPLIDEEHVATAHGRVETTMQDLTNSY